MEPVIGELSVVDHSRHITWNIPNFRQMPNEVDYMVDSPPFSCGDATWSVRIYPNGKSNLGGEGRVSISLVRLGARNQEHRVQFTLGVCRRDGGVYEDFASQYIFDENNLECEAFQFMDRSTVQMHVATPNGEVSAFCRMHVDGNAFAAMRSRIQAVVADSSISNLQQDYLRLLRSGIFSDVILNVRGSEFKAHRVILRARSAVFASLFADDAAEKGTAVVTIDGCDSDTFFDFLQYVYTGRVEALTVGNMFSLYTTADMYDMPDLKEECLEYIGRSISVDNFCDVICLALQYKERELKDIATEYFAKNASMIIVTARWLAFMTKHSGHANELFIVALSRLH